MLRNLSGNDRNTMCLLAINNSVQIRLVYLILKQIILSSLILEMF